MRKSLFAVLPLALWSAGALAVQSPKGVELRVSTDKREYLPYEPVVVTCTIRNASPGEIEIPDSPALGPGNVRFEIAGEDSVYVPYATGPEALGYKTSRSLAAGGAIAREIVVLTSSLGKFAVNNPGVHEGVVPFPLARAGKHLIRASILDTGSGKVSYSNVVEIGVSRYSKENLLEYFASLEDYAAAAGSDYVSPLSPEIIDRWESFVRDHPKSAYAPFVAYNLGEIFLDGTGLEGPEPNRAERMFSLAAERGPKSRLDEALLGVAKSQVAAGNPSDARATTDRLMRLPMAYDTADEARRLRDGLAKGQ